MAKTILGVLSLLVIMSCSIPVKENTVQPNIMETNKKNLGNPLALYPEPTTVAGAEIERKANQLAVEHTGVIGHDRIPVSLSKSHHTNQGIKKAKRLFVNLVSRDMLPKADHVGSVSGATVDKSEAFAILTVACTDCKCAAGPGCPLPYNGGCDQRECLPEIATSLRSSQ